MAAMQVGPREMLAKGPEQLLCCAQGKEVPHICEVLEMPDGSGPLFR